jgi:hypothetical protein
MSDEESYIIRPTDPSSVVRLQDPTVIEQLLEQPLVVIAEVTTGLIASGNGFYAGAGCRLAQAALKGRVFQQFAKEFKELREKGRIPDDFTEKKNGYNSWVELLTILDEETPDDERLEALKAMFFGVNKVGIQDAQRILNYQLFQIAKGLASGELLLLKALEQARGNGLFVPHTRMNLDLWAGKIAGQMGHGVSFLVLKDAETLERHGLINTKEVDPGMRPGGAPSGAGNYVINSTDARLTDLGMRFCENIRSYHLEMSG